MTRTIAPFVLCILALAGCSSASGPSASTMSNQQAQTRAPEQATGAAKATPTAPTSGASLPESPTLNTIKLPAGTGFVTDIAYRGKGTVAVATETGQVLYKADDSANWEHRDFSGQAVQSVTFKGDLLVAARQKALFRYDPAQGTWVSLSSTVPSGVGKVAFFDDQNGLLTLDTGAVLATKDGGGSWNQVGTAGTSSRNPYNDQIAVGSFSQRVALLQLNGSLQRFADGRLRDTGIVPGTASVMFADDKTAWVSGSGGLFRTRDGGVSFDPVRALLLGDRTVDTSSSSPGPMIFADGHTGLLAYGGLFYVTRNGGDAWTSTGLKVPLNAALTSLYGHVEDGRLTVFGYDASQQALLRITVPLAEQS